MNWFDAAIDWPLVVTRALHFAATSMTAGVLLFQAAMRSLVSGSGEAIATRLRRQGRRLAWTGLAVTLASGVLWFLLQAVAISGLPLDQALNSEVLSKVLQRTQFGRVAEIRLVLAAMLAVCLASDRLPLARWLASVVALGLTAAIAWSGHAAATLGELGHLHLAADALHLAAAAGWIGGLVPLAVLLGEARRHPSVAGVGLAQGVTKRFSTLGMISVATLLVTGVVSAWILVGSLHALVVTPYGLLLLLKIVVFAVMLVLAAINRFWLTPQLAVWSADQPRPGALRRLTRNSVVEIALGLAIFAIVGVLGTLHPAIHLVNSSGN
jgi:copper resistance protein D